MDQSSGDGDRTGRRVWIFHGERNRFASGVFGNNSATLEWVARHGLTDVLTEYEVGDGCYDLAVRQGRFLNTKPHHGSARFHAAPRAEVAAASL